MHTFKLWDIFPSELFKEKTLNTPYARWFYCDYNASDFNTKEVKPKYQIYCDFLDKYLEKDYIFVKTTSKDYREDYDKHFEISRDNDITFSDNSLKNSMKKFWYIYCKSSFIDMWAMCKREKFAKHLKNWRYTYIWLLKSKKYKEFRKFIESISQLNKLKNQLFEIKDTYIQDEDKRVLSEKILNSL